MLGAIAREAASAYRQPAKLSKGRSVTRRAVKKAVEAAAKAPAAPDGKAIEKCRHTIKRMRAKTVRCTACVLADAAEGGAALHAAGKLHRDVKPQNILVSLVVHSL
jgi:hypothetical protein